MSKLDGRAVTMLRGCLVMLAVLATGGTAIELAMMEHWEGFTQQIPWLALAVMLAAIVIIIRGAPDHRTVRVVRLMAATVLLAGVIGCAEHVISNHNSGPLSRKYAATWDSMSPVSQWLKAATMQVGPAPPLAPGVLAQAALCLIFSTVGLPERRLAEASDVEA